MDGRDGMRAADADREVVAGRLRVALDEGRLDLHEYDERLQRAYSAKTYGDLDAVVADLPAPATGGSEVAVPPPADPAVPATAAVTRSPTTRWLAENWEPYLTTVGVVVAVWGVIAVLGAGWHYFWPGWVAGPWGAVLLVHTVVGLATGEPARWAAEQERKRLRKAEKRERKREVKAAGTDRDLAAGPVPTTGTEPVVRGGGAASGTSGRTPDSGTAEPTAGPAASAGADGHRGADTGAADRQPVPVQNRTTRNDPATRTEPPARNEPPAQNGPGGRPESPDLPAGLSEVRDDPPELRDDRADGRGRRAADDGLRA
ncbi:DUF1707 SHOCT-like domain-containing protein [Micromonospora fluostatini]|uniref:DUF1707 SHOCT-like domain-containing protein n=1 Tax=Micromonospora sp. JCM 30529 TaxID=3421643 RepID=UPI003D16656B